MEGTNDKGGNMKIISDNHYKLVYRYFEVMALHIIDVLKKNRIENEEQFKEMLKCLLSSAAIDLDQYYIRDKELGDKKFYPMICFRDKEYVKEAQEIVIPDGADDFHDMLPYGVVDDVFEMREKKLGFTYGNECWQTDL